MSADDVDRATVVGAADRLFYAQGVQAVGMDAVRSAAGLSLKRIYALFPSKDDLVVEVLRHRTRQWDDGIAGAAQGATSARERILAIFDFLESWFADSDFRGCAFINAFGELGANSPRVAAAAREQKLAFLRYVSGLVRELGGTDQLATQIAILAEGAQTTAAIIGGPDVARQARSAAETLLEAAAVDA